MNENEIRFIDLFGGIGGFRYGLEKNNRSEPSLSRERKTNSTGSQDIQSKGAKPCFKCVWYCDIDKYAIQTYNKNFNEHYEPTDIRQVNPSDIPEFDMLCGGFPCQSFSIAGKRKGFQDIRGTLFFEIYRIAKAKKTRLLFLENVKGLLSADDGRCFSTIISSLDELGYDCEWQVLNSKYFGVPQNRERVFIVGHLRGTGGQTVFPLRQDNKQDNGNRENETMTLQWDTSGKGYDSQQDRAYDANGIMACLPNANPDNKLNIMVNLHQWRTGEYGNGIKEDESFTLDQGSGRDYCVMNTITGATGNRAGSSKEFLRSVGNINKATGQIRRLTPIECERLQGFPDNWTSGISDTQRYKQLGNAVTTNVITAIGERILEVR